MSARQAGPAVRRRAPMAKSHRTRIRILDAALSLFNQRGTAAVSTNQIAAGAGLSPGNLYYHFTGKQEIIRVLHAAYAAAHEGMWEPGPGGQAGQGGLAELAMLRASLARGMELAWDYRFLERELLALLRADPRLAADYRQVYERRLAQWVAFGERLAADGIIQPPAPPGTIADLALAVWLIAGSWLPFLEITGNPHDPRQVARGGDVVLAVLGPYLTGTGASREGARP